MLPGEHEDVKARLAAAHQKLLEILAESGPNDACLKMIYQIVSVQTDLHAAAVSLLRCQLRTSLQMMMNPGAPNLEEEKKKLIDQYRTWLKFLS